MLFKFVVFCVNQKSDNTNEMGDYMSRKDLELNISPELATELGHMAESFIVEVNDIDHDLSELLQMKWMYLYKFNFNTHIRPLVPIQTKQLI